ncbi:hypothetical protein PROVRUST_07442 [Providencia rustigianii DSM 4541]|uniref:Uncharacterized protein n=1 Tax=Providencia rustigianii DSM 4541 TaxID=500637 RepID=D1P5D7_9GAMM|nr:hypothetical protein PROVRUST_07442 [Providencia rustigianii DSM 4541]
MDRSFFMQSITVIWMLTQQDRHAILLNVAFSQSLILKVPQCYWVLYK